MLPVDGLILDAIEHIGGLYTPAPDFYPVPKLREVDSRLPPTLQDVESHMPAGHQYRHADRATWVHETTHGLNARIRNKYRAENNYPKINAFYVLRDRAVVIREPNITLTDVARAIPESLRGRLYPLYLVQQARYWNDRPGYVIDECVAYGHDARVSREIGRNDYSGALELTNYAVYVGVVAGHSEVELWKFLIWWVGQVRGLFGEIA